MAQTALLQVRIEEEMKRNADRVFTNLGFDTSTAVRIFLNQAIRIGGIPFDIIGGNEEYGMRRDEASTRGLEALRSMRETAKNNGLSGMTLDEINEEIRKARNGEGD